MGSSAWAGPTGLPTRHAILASLHVASLIDETGSLVVDTRESYWHRAAGGRFGPSDFRLGEQLLRDCGLIEQQQNKLWLKPEIALLLEADADDAVVAVCARAADLLPDGRQFALDDLADLLPDATRREELLIALGRRFDDKLRKEIGKLGELIVVDSLRDQLTSLGYPQLARAVRHVSLETDQAGYDISAPRLGGGKRLIEVKTTTNLGERASFFLSRNEYETSQNYRDWFLVLCEITNLERRDGRIIGWLAATFFPSIVPHDAVSGRWESAQISFGVDKVVMGLPGASG